MTVLGFQKADKNYISLIIHNMILIYKFTIGIINFFYVKNIFHLIVVRTIQLNYKILVHIIYVYTC